MQTKLIIYLPNSKDYNTEQILGSIYRKDWIMYIGRTRDQAETRFSCEGICSLSDSIRLSTRSGKTNSGMLQQGIIKPSRSRMASPLVIVNGLWSVKI